MSFTAGGTTPWMSPELLDPDRFGISDGRPTKQSDCYSLGMVVYEVCAERPSLFSRRFDSCTTRFFVETLLIRRSRTNRW